MTTSLARRADAAPQLRIAMLAALWALGMFSTTAAASLRVRRDPCVVPDHVVVAEAGYSWTTEVWTPTGTPPFLKKPAVITEFTVLRRAAGPPLESFTVVQVTPTSWSDSKTRKLIRGAAYLLLLTDVTNIQPGTHQRLFLAFYVPDVSALDDDATLRRRWRDLCQQRILDAAARPPSKYFRPPPPGAPTEVDVRKIVPGSYPP